MNHPRRPMLYFGFTLALALIVVLGLAGPVLAASIDDIVEWNGTGHLLGANVCGDSNYPYRSPITPNADQSAIIRVRSYSGDLTSVTVWYTTDASALDSSDWTTISASQDASPSGCGVLGAMDSWVATIPDHPYRVWYKIRYVDGTSNAWQRGSGEAGVGVFNDDGGWGTDSTSLTYYSPPTTVYVDDSWAGSAPGSDPSGQGGLNFGGNAFATIHDGFNAVATGGIINVESGFYTETLTLNKAVTLQGDTGASSPIANVQGPCTTALLNVTAPNVTLRQLYVKVNQTTCLTGIAATGTYDGLTVDINHIESTGTATGIVSNSYGINLSGTVSSPIVITDNAIEPESDANSAFEHGIQLTNTYATISGNTINAYYAIQSNDAPGPLQISNNTLYGSTVLIAPEGGATHRFENNICGASLPLSAPVASNVFALLEVRNLRDAATLLEVNVNQFLNFSNFGVFLGRSNNVRVDGNTFTPLLDDESVTNYRDLHINTKERTLGVEASATVSNITVISNTFNGNGHGGVGIELADHQTGAAPAFQNITVGADNNGNHFNATLATYLRLDPLAGNSDTLPLWGTQSCGAISCTNTTMAPVALNLDTQSNFFEFTGGSDLPAGMGYPQLAELEDRIVHHIDYAALGVVQARPGYLLITPASYLPPFTLDARPQRGVEIAQPGDRVHIMPGLYTDAITITQPIVVEGDNPSNPTIIYPTVSGLGSNLILVQTNTVTIHDLTLDGDNPALTGGVNVGGANVDARNGITETSGPYNNLTVYNSTIRNIYWHGIDAGSGAAGLNLTAYDNLVQNVQGEAFSTAGGSALIQNNNISLSKWAVGVSGGDTTVTGNHLQTVTSFNQSGGNLLAYANTIDNDPIGLAWTAGTTNLRHNWWGTYTSKPTGIFPADWQARLGAPIEYWAEGNISVTLDGAVLSGGTGTAVIVHQSLPPFDVWVDKYGNKMCSAYYDFFTENSSGLWSVSVPVSGIADCDDTYNKGKIYSIPYTTTYSTECTSENPACWDRIMTNVITGNRMITVTSLSTTALGGTQFVVGSTSGTDPTAITLSAFAAHADRVTWLPFGLALISLAAVLIVWRRRR
jgi:hypothetical protein